MSGQDLATRNTTSNYTTDAIASGGKKIPSSVDDLWHPAALIGGSQGEFPGVEELFAQPPGGTPILQRRRNSAFDRVDCGTAFTKRLSFTTDSTALTFNATPGDAQSVVSMASSRSGTRVPVQRVEELEHWLPATSSSIRFRRTVARARSHSHGSTHSSGSHNSVEWPAPPASEQEPGSPLLRMHPESSDSPWVQKCKLAFAAAEDAQNINILEWLLTGRSEGKAIAAVTHELRMISLNTQCFDFESDLLAQLLDFREANKRHGGARRGEIDRARALIDEIKLNFVPDEVAVSCFGEADATVYAPFIGASVNAVLTQVDDWLAEPISFYDQVTARQDVVNTASEALGVSLMESGGRQIKLIEILNDHHMQRDEAEALNPLLKTYSKDELNAWHDLALDPNLHNTAGETLMAVALKNKNFAAARLLAQHGATVDINDADGQAILQNHIGVDKGAVDRALAQYEDACAETRKSLLFKKNYSDLKELLASPNEIPMSKVIQMFCLGKGDWRGNSMKTFLAAEMGFADDFDPNEPAEVQRAVERWSFDLLTIRFGLLPKDQYASSINYLSLLHRYAFDHLDNSDGCAVLDALYQLDMASLKRMDIAVEPVLHDSPVAHAGAVAVDTLEAKVDGELSVDSRSLDQAVTRRLSATFIAPVHTSVGEVPAPLQHVIKRKRRDSGGVPLEAELKNEFVAAVFLPDTQWRNSLSDVLQDYKTRLRQRTCCSFLCFKSNYKAVKGLVKQQSNQKPFGEMIEILSRSSGSWKPDSMKTLLLKSLSPDATAFPKDPNHMRTRVVPGLARRMIFEQLGITALAYPNSYNFVMELCGEALSNLGRRGRKQKAVDLLNELYRLDVSDLRDVQAINRDEIIRQRLYENFCEQKLSGTLGLRNSRGLNLFKTCGVFCRTKMHERVMKIGKRNCPERSTGMPYAV